VVLRSNLHLFREIRSDGIRVRQCPSFERGAPPSRRQLLVPPDGTNADSPQLKPTQCGDLPYAGFSLLTLVTASSSVFCRLRSRKSGRHSPPLLHTPGIGARS
jgi:hypothetical protein